MEKSLSTAKDQRRRLLVAAISSLILQGLFVVAASADLFEDNPPAWEPLLWGGKLTSNHEEGQRAPESAVQKILTRGPGRSDVVEKQGGTGQQGSPDTREGSNSTEVFPDGTGALSSPVSAGQTREANGEQPPRGSESGLFQRPLQTLQLPNIPPLYLTPRLQGEGEWQSQGMPVGPDGQPTIYKTSYRPSTQYANAIVHMLLFDMSRLTVNLYIGSTEPGGSVRTSTVPIEERPSLVAVTNALWKQKHSGEAGTIYRGQELKRLAPGMATLVVYKDGSVDILEWNEGIPSSIVQDAKQLRHLIVKDGKVVDSIIKGGRRSDPEIGLGYLLVEDESAGYQNWYGYGGYGYGSSPPQHTDGPDWFIATRSAFGIRPDGNLVFAVGHHISTRDLAKALVLAGCERAIHGDANPHNVLGNIYHYDQEGVIRKKAKLSPDQKTYTLDRYVDKSYTSDFFGFFTRSSEGDAS